ncbi:uncharacterized protein N7459_008974 [Penicillium hispanicum]|uniref:uncharacterized protein n=1 Tax=Penicillium hispanicum TaxID=1080232 RepID=UPI0025405F28|nr:uncharacterized protein N7459_008974 [Penicillium hispanicum]KAJ5569544.1 hypothetical protein N7459_008974 [Penicillium hispanicum]
MQLTTLLPVFLSTLSLASALPRRSEPATWKASDSSINCSPGGCIAKFNIKAAKTANSPGFNVHCEGPTPNATVCNSTDITTHVNPLGDSVWNVWVQHEWIIQPKNESDQENWQSGNTNITNTDPTFLITPDHFYGVA